MKAVLERAIVVLLFATFSFAISISSAQAADTNQTTSASTANEIMTKVAQVYRDCRSYSDSGVVKTVFFSKNDKDLDEKPFTTAFVRPDQFRFESTSNPPKLNVQLPLKFKDMKFIIWQKGNDIRTWWTIEPGKKKEISLSMAIAAATGISGGAAHTIPALLMPTEVGGQRITEYGQYKRIADAKLDSANCFCIQGKLNASDSEAITIWIDKTTYLIIRIDEANKFPDFRTESTTTYNPKINITIDKDKLTFNVPK
jgi:hypothetical protein